MQEEEQHVKVLFRYYSDILEQEITETMWAIEVDAAQGLYRLDSIPFYGPDIASDDIFFAAYDAAEEMLTFREVREPSGNSILQVVIMMEPYNDVQIREKLSELGCLSESLNERFFAVEVPAALDYQ